MTPTRMLSVGVAAVAAAAAFVPAAAVFASKLAVRNVRVVDDEFLPAKVTIKRGTNIKWSWSAANFAGHNVKLIKGPKGSRAASSRPR